MKTPATQPELPHSAGMGAMRFSYASGSRPLDGYTIKRGIGVGGFGEVYFAVSDAGKEVALKRIQRNLDVEIRGVSQCLNLKHPNLISLYDIRYDDEGQGWVVMEYVPGESLTDVLERNPHGLPQQEALRWFEGLAQGVAHLHDHGIVHRDLKPANIFLDDNLVKIGDYGLSKFISCSRRSGQTESVGTFHYMAPEIGKGSYGKEIDIYALGIILYELLTGRVPFEGESSQEIIMKHLTADPDLRGVPAVFRGVIQRALAKDPQDRFSDVSELLAATRRAASTGPAAEAPLYIGDAPEDEGIYLGPLREHPATSPTRREPLAAAAGESGSRVRSWWRQAGTPLKIAVLVIGLLMLLANAAWLVPLAAMGGALYLVYLGVYSLFATAGAAPAPATPIAGAPIASAIVAVPPQVRPAVQRRRTPVRWQDQARQQFCQRTRSETLGELSGAMLMAAIVALVASLVLLPLGGKSLDRDVSTWTFFAWLSLTSILGAWMILALGKAWERSEGESVLRRFVLLIAGLLLGAASFGLSDFLGVRLSDDLVVRGLPGIESPDGMYEADGSPRLAAFLMYFGALFLAVRWWLQSDPLRLSRLSLWATAACVVWAWIIHLFWQFPQPWGFMLAVAISTAVQLSAPWMPTRQRSQIRRQCAEA